MKRYGNLELLKEKFISEVQKYYCIVGNKYNIGYLVDDVLSTIDSIPTIEFIDKKYSYWEYDPNGNDWGLGAWICHECNVKNDNIPADKNINPFFFAGSKFCPNCGSTMIQKKG